ncbi:MAG: Elongation factor 4 [Elusimicrobia bacterium]|nr:Elongation factor 4 [Elusimicrobiota bacterium]
MTTKKETTHKKKKTSSEPAVAKAKKTATTKSRKKTVKEDEPQRVVSLKPFITPPPAVVVPPPAPKMEPIVVSPQVLSKPVPPPPPPPLSPSTPSSQAPSPVKKVVEKIAPSKPAISKAPTPKTNYSKPTSPHQALSGKSSPSPSFLKPSSPAPSFSKKSSASGPSVAVKSSSVAPEKPAESSVSVEASPVLKKIQFNEMMSVKDMAAAMNVGVAEVIKKLLTLGTPASINQRLNSDTAALLAEAFGYQFEVKSLYRDEESSEPDPEGSLKPRPPVVTVMGHVDHGKTSLLDAIRSTSVVKGESGGITQHIGAYQVKVEKGVITFLDTPGHEAFTAMRARGAMATDIVILVVAADDSVMPQTIEAIDHAKAAGVPIVVAINKIDLPTANVQKVKQELAGHELVAEDWGGKTVMVEVSAKTKVNIDKLLEMILLEAELLELKANPDRTAKGIVLEAHMDPKRGITANVLIQSGTLKMGDIVVCGLTHGRVRAMLGDNWETIDVAGPSRPVRLLGLSQVPQVGDQLSVVDSDREAREIAEHRKQFFSDAAAKKTSHISLEGLHAKIAEGKIQDLPIILKTDVQGSLQAIQDSLGKLTGYPIQLRYVHSGIGNINESDVLLAEASDAIVFGFHVKVEGSAETEAKRAGVDIRTYQIIYEMLADVKAAMEGLLKPVELEVVKGRAVVKGTFPSAKYGMIAGCMVTEGKVTRNAKARVIRGGELVGEGGISSLRRFKDDVKEVEKGYECGLSVDNVRSFSQGDLIEVFVIEKHARRLDA